MRTTIALDADLLEKLRSLAAKRRTSLREVVNETLRRGLVSPAPRAAKRRAYRVETFRSAFRAGVDPLRLNQLADELDVTARTEAAR
jgi:hypothetical protein